MDHSDVKLMAADGVRPDSDSIARDQYSLIHEFNAVIRADEALDCPAWILPEWLKTDDARQRIRDEGDVLAN